MSERIVSLIVLSVVVAIGVGMLVLVMGALQAEDDPQLEPSPTFCIDIDDDTLTDAELKAVIDEVLDIDFPLC